MSYKDLCRFCGKSDPKIVDLFADEELLRNFKLTVPFPVILTNF
jgi:hypothetical protein